MAPQPRKVELTYGECFNDLGSFYDTLVSKIYPRAGKIAWMVNGDKVHVTEPVMMAMIDWYRSNGYEKTVTKDILESSGPLVDMGGDGYSALVEYGYLGPLKDKPKRSFNKKNAYRPEYPDDKGLECPSCHSYSVKPVRDKIMGCDKCGQLYRSTGQLMASRSLKAEDNKVYLALRRFFDED